MADPSTVAPQDRGRLVVADRVVERIASIAAGEIVGVAVVGSALDRAVGRSYPRADAHVAGDRARVTLEIAVAWPTPLAGVTSGVRDAVRARLTELVGLQIDRVDVTAAKVFHRDEHRARRVR